MVFPRGNVMKMSQTDSCSAHTTHPNSIVLWQLVTRKTNRETLYLTQITSRNNLLSREY